MKKVVVWVVEDDATYRRMLSKILTGADGIAQCLTFPSCPDLFSALETETAPDVVLMDLGLPQMSGIEGIRILSRKAPETAVIALTVFGDKRVVIEALESGARGYLLKSSNTEQILSGISDVVQGGSSLSPAVARIVLDNIRAPSPALDLKLPAREIEVLEHLALGLTVKEIAAAIGISESTVSTYLARIYNKLEVQSQSGAVAKALRHGLIR